MCADSQRTRFLETFKIYRSQRHENLDIINIRHPITALAASTGWGFF